MNRNGSLSFATRRAVSVTRRLTPIPPTPLIITRGL